MKKSGKVLAFSAAMIASASLTGCDMMPVEMIQDLYNSISGGPEEYNPDDNLPEALYAGPDYWNNYDPEENIEDDIYAGPGYWDEYDVEPEE